MTNQRTTVKVNSLGFVSHSESSSDPFRIDRDGEAYVPTGDGGIVLNYRVGDSVFALDADHPAPGVSLSHPNPDAAHALVAQSCIGNRAHIRTGAAAGAFGAVLGKRGEGSRVLVIFTPEILKLIKPDDQISIETEGQGLEDPAMESSIFNISSALFSDLNYKNKSDGKFRIPVRTTLESKLVGNGIGRPMPLWDLDLQLSQTPADVSDIKIGDFVAITNLDSRFNAGYRKGWVSVGVIVHGSSPQPGHGPGVTIFLSGPESEYDFDIQPVNHIGLTEEKLLTLAGKMI
ncbi:unannotated protein [freshwater metagenome]|uniref:Unannotated protein n=1 Tax=freshwater metagenome TaxID=449393 RepID=A0A6J7EF57_9ZZZZ|nr:DUF4438 domain-containing protein [Actinomycetota bacterium]MSX19938.1 DUF4438 domain-containing protein [Actinomycetota bacterium]MSX70079.1 DUF4438 domain-containing protein [Actinomycetota bacterium]MSY93485.1 DUF4438 domain-containing protein [Actinomycetota bacterium]